MKLQSKVKALAAAVAMLAGVQAHAAIETDGSQAGPFAGTGAGELVLTVIKDRGTSNAASYTLDLGITASDFRSGAITSLAISADPTLTSFLTGAGSVAWSVTSVDNRFSLPDFGYLTTSATARNLGNVPTGGFGGLNTPISAWGNYAVAVNQATGNSNPADNLSVVRTVGQNGFWDNTMGANWDGTSVSAEAGLGQSMGFYFVGLNPNDQSAGTTRVDTLADGIARFWSLALDGTLSYSAAAAIVPVPAAVWLFGSALVGLVGVARRRSVK